jgi:hypothetical protein
MSTVAARRRGGVIGYVLVAIVIVAALAAVPYLRSLRTPLLREAAAIRAELPTNSARLDSLNGAVSAAAAMLALEKARAEARAEPTLHLVVAVDSGTVALMRDGITLRTMAARFTGTPARGTHTIAGIAVRPIASLALTVDSTGQRVTGVPVDSTVERVTLSDGTILEGGDTAAVLLGGVDVAPGPRMILLSRRDFAAIRPNLVTGMKAMLF